MKFLTIGFLLISCSIASIFCITKEEGLEMAKALLTECKNQEGGSEFDYNDLLAMKFPSTRSGMCMISCIHEKIGFFTNGVFNRKNFLLFIRMATDGHENHEQFMQLGEVLADKCGDASGERCDQAMNFDKCMEVEVKERGIEIPFL